MFWASKLYAEDDPDHTGNAYNRMLYATTRDFVTFSEAKIWQDRGESRIDSTVIKENDTYYRFTKDEGGGGTGCSDIIQEKSPTADRRRPARRPGVGVHGRLHRPRRRHLRRRGTDRLQGQPG